MPVACVRRAAVAPTMRGIATTAGLRAPTSRNSTMSVGTYSAVLPCARKAMNRGLVGSVGSWEPPGRGDDELAASPARRGVHARCTRHRAGRVDGPAAGTPVGARVALRHRVPAGGYGGDAGRG